MMKLAVTALSLFLVLNLSQAKTSVTAQVQESPKHSVLKTPTQTKNVLARAIPKSRRLRLVTNDLHDGENGPLGSDELDLHGPYRRPQVSTIEPVDEANKDSDDLSDYVTVRLAVARARAMETYRKHWC